MYILSMKLMVATASPRWFARLVLWSVSIAALCALGCAESIVLRGYANKPLSHPPELPADSGAYVASSYVPWCVDLHDAKFTLEEVREFRKRFYAAYRDLEEGKPLRALSVAPTAVLREIERGAEFAAKPSCWSVAQQVAGDLGLEEHDHYIIALALPGGGSRAAVFSAAVMFELELQKIMRRVDVISSVSGGSLAAGLYARSCNDKAECDELYGLEEPVLWAADQEDAVFNQLGTNFIWGELLRMARPWNWFLYRLTPYTRTHTMAEVYASHLFKLEGKEGRHGMTFQQLNPRRPNWWVNSVNTTGERLDPGLKDKQFLFTLEGFEHDLHSDLHTYPVAHAVTASTAFPGAFYPLPVAVFPTPADGEEGDGEPVGYRHLVDGGLYDRLGGEAFRVFFENLVEREEPCLPAIPSPNEQDERDCADRAIAIVLDSGLPIKGEDPTDVDVRTPVLDLLVSSNIAMAPFALLEIQAQLRLDALHAFAEALNDRLWLKHGRKEWVFQVADIRLRDVERCVANPVPCAQIEGLQERSPEELTRTYKDFWEEVLDVPLSLRISEKNAQVLRRAARIVTRLRIMNDCQRETVFLDCTLYDKLAAPPPQELEGASPPKE